MKFFRFIESHFGLLMAASIGLALLFPYFSQAMRPLLEPALMFILFLVFLKVDVLEVLHGLKQFKLMVYVIGAFLFFIPIFIYSITQFFSPEFALGLLLLTSMPAGMAAPALTDFLKGNTALTMIITLITSLFAPFTVPLIFSLFHFNGVSVDALEMFKTLFFLILIPMIASHVAKHYFRTSIDRLKPTFSAMNVLILCLILYSVIGEHQSFIFSDPSLIVKELIVLYGFFIFLHVLGYFLASGRSPQDKIAFLVSRAYMNNSLAIVLAAKFFSPSIVLMMVLSEIPWSTLPGFYKKTILYFQGRF